MTLLADAWWWSRASARDSGGRSPWPARGPAPTWCSPPGRRPAWTRWPRRSRRWGGAGWRSPPTSPTASQPDALAATALDAFGRVDTLVNNAFAIPPMTSLADADLDALRTAFETNVLAALRLTRLFTPALAASRGSVVMINSDGAAASPSVNYGGRTRWPSRPCWRWRRAWPPNSARRGSGSTRWPPATSGATRCSGTSATRREQARRGRPADLRRDRGHHRPAQAAGAGRDRRRGGVPGLATWPGPSPASASTSTAASTTTDGCGDHMNVERHRHGGGPARLGHQAHRADDFGADDYRDGLAVLLESYARDADLTAAGQQDDPGLPARRAGGPAAQRGGWARHPEHADVGIERPDLRHRAAPHRHHRAAPAAHRRPGTSGPGDVADASCRSPARRARPGPPTRCSSRSRRPSSGTTSSTPSSWACTTWPPTRWRSAGSCCGSRCGRSPTSAWPTCRPTPPGCAGQDWTGAYRRHRRNLQLIGLPDRDRRWVLKNPSHLFALDALLRGLPGRARDPDPPGAPGRDRVRLQPGRPGQ